MATTEVTVGVIKDASITAAKMAANSIDSASYVNGSIDAEHLAANSVDSDSYVNGSIDPEHLADNAVTLAKMASGTDGNIISFDSSGNPVAIATGTDGQVLTSAGAGAQPAFEDAGGGLEIIHVQDQRPNGTAGGTSQALSVRILNTSVVNTMTGASLSSNRVTLPAGTFHVFCQGPVYGSAATSLHVYNITDSSFELVGPIHDFNSTGGVAYLCGVFTTGASKVFELRQRYQTAGASGLGDTGSWDDGKEVYGSFVAVKVG